MIQKNILFYCRSIPSILEFSSYTFSFHMLLCGPFCFYKDFIAFIDGSDLKGKDNSVSILYLIHYSPRFAQN